MRIVYDSFEGRYSDNPRALYEWLRPRVPGEHIWLTDPRHLASFPPGTLTVPHDSTDAVVALESADLVIGNTHIDLDWDKRPETTYLQTWHGTPLKRIHHDVVFAPPGRLPRLDRDVARWDYLLSPNAASTPRLRKAFNFPGEVLEYGYPRNDVLLPPRADLVRARVRASLGLTEGDTAVLYTPTWRDHAYYDPTRPPVQLALDVAPFLAKLGPGVKLLPRLHYLMTDRGMPLDHPDVIDVSYYPDVAELYLAADVMVTDYSSTMFDFAVTGKPLLFYTYDLDEDREHERGFYYDLEPIAPGPMISNSEDLVAALQDLPGVQRTYAGRYRRFQAMFCGLEDGRATKRLGRFLKQRVLRADAPLTPA